MLRKSLSIFLDYLNELYVILRPKYDPQRNERKGDNDRTKDCVDLEIRHLKRGRKTVLEYKIGRQVQDYITVAQAMVL